MAEQEMNLIDLLQVEGVDFKGFGTISKLIMTDTELHIGAKALYAYLCSYTGKGSTAYPKRDKILYDLDICKTAYYKYQQQLIDNGYIKVERAEKYPFKNIYTIVSRPPKISDYSVNLKDKKQLVAGGIKAFGYGSIPKAVMIDTRLSIKAKALYAYFCSFAGNGTCAFPKQKDILYHLHISINTLTSYMRQLIECNYITVEQQHENGRFDSNIYYINDMPNEEIGKLEIDRRAEYQKQKQAKQQGLVNLPTSEKVTAKPRQKADSKEHHEESVSVKKRPEQVVMPKFDNSLDNESPHYALEEIAEYERLIKDNIEYDYLKAEGNVYIDLILDVMVEAVTSTKEYLRINKQAKHQEIVKSRLLKLEQDHIEYVTWALSEITTMPNNLRAYILTTLYNSYTSMDSYFTLRVKHDRHESENNP